MIQRELYMYSTILNRSEKIQDQKNDINRIVYTFNNVEEIMKKYTVYFYDK